VAVVVLAAACLTVGPVAAKASKYCAEVGDALDDKDHDGIPDPCDNCRALANASQADHDLDGEGNACDLDDAMVMLRFDDQETVAWQGEMGFDRWNWYRGDLAVLKAHGSYTQNGGPIAQRLCGLYQPFLRDVQRPLPGQAMFYMISGSRGLVEGGLGRDSTGQVRAMTLGCKPTIFSLGKVELPPLRLASGGSCQVAADPWRATFHNVLAWNSQLRDVILDRASLTYTWSDATLGVTETVLDLAGVVVEAGEESSVSFAPIDPTTLGPSHEGESASVRLAFEGQTETGNQVALVWGSSLSVPVCSTGVGCEAPAGQPCFDPDPTEEPPHVSLSGGDAGSGVIDLVVKVRNVQRVYGASFRVEFDDTLLAFDGWEPGSLLEGYGATAPAYLVSSPQDGVVTLGASRLGTVPGAIASSADGRVLMTLRFRTLGPGTARVELADGELYDGQAVPIDGLDWSGGSISIH
jgi:hypothetical protein